MSSVIVVKRGYRRAVIAAGMRGAPGAGGGGSAGVSSFNARTGPVTLVSADVSDALGYTPANSASLAGVALSGAYADLSGLPAIPAAPGDIGAATAAQGAKADAAVQPGALASVATSGSYVDLSAKPFIPALPGDIGAATAAQGAAADTAVQPAALASGLAGKVDKDGAKVLSDQNYTLAEKNKLAGLDGAPFKGLHINLAALQAAHPSAVAGDYADVDSGAGADVARYIWDVSDSAWIIQSGASGSMTAAQIKTAYESNPDTNAFSDAEQSKLGAIAPGATANATDAQLRDRSTHTGTQAASTISDFASTVRDTVLTGLSLASGAAIAAGDSALVAWGKLQKQINDLVAAVSGKQETLVSGTNIKTLNGSSLLGTGNLNIAGGGMTNPMTTAGDLIVGGSAGVPNRLPVGATGKVLGVVAGSPAWVDPADGGFTGGTLTGALNEAPTVTIAAATTVNIGAAAANTVSVTGSVTISAFDTIAAGATRRLVFGAALTLTHNSTSMILPAGANIITAAGDSAEFLSLGSGNWRCIGYLRADGTPLAGGGGGAGLTHFVEAKNTAAPNATMPAVSLSVTITETSGDAVFQPKGSGAVLAQVPDSSASGGAKRGALATDWQRSRSAADQVASATGATIGGGSSNKASGAYSAVAGGTSCGATNAYATVGGGNINTASGTNSTVGGGEVNTAGGVAAAIGGGSANNAGGANSVVSGGASNSSSMLGASVLGGVSNAASGGYSSVLGGYFGTCRGIYGAEVRASGRFAAQGDAQRGRYIKRCSTSTATPATLGTDGLAGGATNQVILPNNSAYTFMGKVVARENATGDCAAWEFKGLIRRGANAAATALVAAVTPTSIAADAGASTWVVAVTADTTNGGIAVTVTGEASHTIRWVADIETVEVVG